MTSAPEAVSAETRVARELAAALKRNGVPYLFGIPGGGSSIDLIEACRAEDIPFVLVQHETTAALMAVVCGELTGSCGACISIMGTGAINLAGCATYAFLERHPLLCITETYGLDGAPLMSIQKIDHGATFAPYCKDEITLGSDDPGRQIDDAIRLAMAERPGPIHVDYPQSMDGGPPARTARNTPPAPSRPEGDLEAIANEIDRAEKPIIIAGPVVLRQHAESELLRLAERLHCAVMVTSKARGVISEDHPLYAGIISGVYGEGTLEGRMVHKSDTVLAIGLDRMELLTPWKHRQPLLTLDVIPVSADDAVGEPLLTASGPMPMLLDSLTATVRQRSTWQTSEIEDFWSQAMNELGAEGADLNAASVPGQHRHRFRHRPSRAAGHVGGSQQLVSAQTDDSPVRDASGVLDGGRGRRPCVGRDADLDGVACFGSRVWAAYLGRRIPVLDVAAY